MKKHYHEYIFEVSKFTPRGERRHKKSVLFDSKKHLPMDECIQKCVEALRDEHYRDIKYVEVRSKYLIFAD